PVRLREGDSAWLGRLLQLGYALKRLGISRVVSSLGVLKLFRLGALGEADGHVEEVPSKFLFESLRQDFSLRETKGPHWHYFAACGTNYLFPKVGSATIAVLKRHFGRGAFLENPCCGLLCYNYGDLEAARRLARRNIERFESASRESAENSPLVADCSSCVAHLKIYPQLFLDDPRWKARAEKFCARVR